jgi:hypothetical protein
MLSPTPKVRHGRCADQDFVHAVEESMERRLVPQTKDSLGTDSFVDTVSVTEVALWKNEAGSRTIKSRFRLTKKS